MNAREIALTTKEREHWSSIGSRNVRRFLVNGWLQVIVSVDAGLWHLSVSHPSRYPTWDEIRDIRYALLPNDMTFGILLPPKEQYVNVHENCFHLHEIPQVHEPIGLIVTP